MTYGEVGAARTAIGSGLVQNGIPKGSCVGLYMINRPEWVVTELACGSYSYISVPLYDTLGADAVKYIINHAEVTALFCTPDKLQNLLPQLSELPSVRLIVVVGGTESLPSLPSRSGIDIVPYSRLKAQGLADTRSFIPPRPHDVATLCYTSGTTGVPKGAMLTHYSLVASAAGSTTTTKFFPSDVYVKPENPYCLFCVRSILVYNLFVNMTFCRQLILSFSIYLCNVHQSPKYFPFFSFFLGCSNFFL
jgi:long-chain acyl-CoA synthetase